MVGVNTDAGSRDRWSGADGRGQVAGIGRHGHTWHPKPKPDCTCRSCCGCPSMRGSADGDAGAGAGRAGSDLESFGLAADLRWPNDVLIGGKKCAGILAQLEGDAVVAGIGINVNHSNFPARSNRWPRRSSWRALPSRARTCWCVAPGGGSMLSDADDGWTRGDSAACSRARPMPRDVACASNRRRR